MSQSKDVCTANALPSLANDDDDELEKLLEEALNDLDDGNDVSIEPKRDQDVTLRYHEMMRRALVDFGDEIIDTLVAKFGKSAKLIGHIEDVRKEVIDPLRKPIV